MPYRHNVVYVLVSPSLVAIKEELRKERENIYAFQWLRETGKGTYKYFARA